jgi:hypothetical protein
VIGAKAAVARLTMGTASVLSSRPIPRRSSTAVKSTLNEPQVQAIVMFWLRKAMTAIRNASGGLLA